MMTKCDECGTEIRAAAAVCPECGAPQQAAYTSGAPRGDARPTDATRDAALATARSEPELTPAAAPSSPDAVPGGAEEQPRLWWRAPVSPAMSAGAAALLLLESVVVAGIAYLLEPAPPERARFRGVYPDVGATGDLPTTPIRSKLVRIRIHTASASSKHGGHPAWHAADKNVSTAWNASAPNAAGQWIELELAGRARVRQVEVWPGFWGRSRRGAALFPANARPARITVTTGSRSVVQVVPDVEAPVLVDLAVNSDPPEADSIRIVVDSAYPGSKYTDLCITEVIVRGREGEVSEGVVDTSGAPLRFNGGLGILMDDAEIAAYEADELAIMAEDEAGAAMMAAALGSQEEPDVASCRIPACEVPSGDAREISERAFGLLSWDPSQAACLAIHAAQRAELEEDVFTMGAAYFNLGKALESMGCGSDAYPAYRTSLCKRPRWGRRPGVIGTVTRACAALGLGPCDTSCAEPLWHGAR